jgi:hypothetical protein
MLTANTIDAYIFMIELHLQTLSYVGQFGPKACTKLEGYKLECEGQA